jgi:hypothetical protein
MAHLLNKLIAKAASIDKFMVICGVQHMAYGLGVPERIWMYDEDTKE